MSRAKNTYTIVAFIVLAIADIAAIAAVQADSPLTDAARTDTAKLDRTERRLRTAILATLPSSNQMPEPAPWSALEDGDIRERMDTIHAWVTTELAAAMRAIRDDELAFQSLPQLERTFRARSVDIDAATLAG